MKRRIAFGLGVAFSAAVLAPLATASAQNILTNGGFATDLTGWDAYYAPGSVPESGRYYWTAGGPDSSPVLGNDLPLPYEGSGYAVTDMNGPGAGSLSQSFTIASAPSSAILSFAMFLSNQNTVSVIGDGFFFGTPPDFLDTENQQVRIDLLSGTPSDPLSVGADVLHTFFQSGDSDFDWTMFSFDLTPYLTTPGTYTIRFAEVDNQGLLYNGVDDVSLVLNGSSTTVPEPATLSLLATGLLGLGAARRRRRA